MKTNLKFLCTRLAITHEMFYLSVYHNTIQDRNIATTFPAFIDMILEHVFSIIIFEIDSIYKYNAKLGPYFDEFLSFCWH